MGFLFTLVGIPNRMLTLENTCLPAVPLLLSTQEHLAHTFPSILDTNVYSNFIQKSPKFQRTKICIDWRRNHCLPTQATIPLNGKEVPIHVQQLGQYQKQYEFLKVDKHKRVRERNIQKTEQRMWLWKRQNYRDKNSNDDYHGLRLGTGTGYKEL